ncbi:MAG: histidine phosphatase family protein [Lentisphaeria bacterium]
MAENLILVRHGRGGPQRPGAFVGRTDVGLDDAGRRQAAALRPLLAESTPAAVFCSPLRRARETAALALPGVPATVLPELAEIHFGEWEGRTFAEIAAASPEEVAAWIADEAGYRFPGGEAIAEFRARVGWAAATLAAAAAAGAGTVVAFTHGGVIRTMICTLLGLPPAAHLAFQIECATVTRLRLYEGKGVLAGLGLAAPPEPAAKP